MGVVADWHPFLADGLLVFHLVGTSGRQLALILLIAHFFFFPPPVVSHILLFLLALCYFPYLIL
jgi:hypothetical protein